jgi:hypothetical protein
VNARISLAIGWVALLAAPVAMVIGHLGQHELGWMRNQISTYAARGPSGDWITAALLLSALALLCLGLAIASRRLLGAEILNQLALMLFAVAVAGLVLLAGFKEAAIGVEQLKQLGYTAIRQQTFHDAGLLLFFVGATAAFAGAGLIVLLRGPHRLLALGVVLTGPLTLAAMAAPWPQYLGIADAGIGLKQRAAFLLMWIAALLLLAATTKDPRSRRE